MVLPLDLREQFLDIVQIPAAAQSQFAGACVIGTAPGGLFNRLQTSAKRLIDHEPEGRVQLLRNGSRSVKNVIVY